MSRGGLEGRPGNRDLGAARAYHEHTSHTAFSVRTSGHALDFDNYPHPFKIYEDLERLALQREGWWLDRPALDAVATVTCERAEAVPARADLACLLQHSAGVTRTRTFGAQQMYFRAAANTGALYEIELYLVCGDLPGLSAGVYHYAPREHGLDVLRRGDHRGLLVEATGGEPAVARAPAVLICSGVYWRNAWKYQARTYRHFGWDNGTLLANTLAICAALDLPARLVCGFSDADVNRLLDLDTAKEVAFSLVALGRTSERAPASPKVAPLGAAVRPYSAGEVDYPLMRDVHAASSLHGGAEVAAWRTGRRGAGLRSRAASDRSIPLPAREHSADGILPVIRRRGSTRRFTTDPISAERLAAILHAATRGLSADYLDRAEVGEGPRLNHLYLIVNAVQGLPSGAYYHANGRLDLLRPGNFRGDAGFLDLEQDLAADAAVNVYFMADLGDVLGRFGNRGYRLAQLEAGILGGKLYLASYALALGATGLTFYDDDVTAFFAPHAAGLSAIFLVAVGVPDRKH